MVTARPAAPRVYLITDRAATRGRPLEVVIAAALRAVTKTRVVASPGAVAVQVREKDLEGRALLELARRVHAVTNAAGVRLFINDRVDVALAVGADGVHLGRGALAVDDIRAVAPAMEIAVSTHSSVEVARAAADGRISFVVFGPVFATPSKQMRGEPQGTSALRAVCGGSLPVLALGGVDSTNASDCIAAGASGIACIRSVMSAVDPRAALERLFEAIEST